MPRMILGSLTFARNPNTMECLIPQRFSSSVMTYNNVAFFSWGADIVGKKVSLGWDYMPSAQFDNINDLWAADEEVIFNPQDGTGKTYQVQITNLSGEYFIQLPSIGGYGTHLRKQVKIELLIVSVNP